MLEQVGLSDRIHHYPHQLSGGASSSVVAIPAR
jgi:predicted ABC-type transport system involved in lysophospholipase L1 biosynthesis ATPase subunit